MHMRPGITPGQLRLAEVAVLLVMACWGVNVVAVKAAIRDIPPVLFAFLRFGSAFLLMLAFLKWREGSVRLPRSEVLPVLALGLAGFGIYQDLWVTALGKTTAGNSALITAATPVPTMLIAAAIGSDVLSLRKAAGALVALAGVVAVVATTHGVSFTGASAGDLLTVAATICWAFYVAFGTPVLARQSALRTSTWAIGLGCLGMLPLAIPQLAAADLVHVPARTWGLLAFSSVVAGAATNVAMFSAVRVLGPSRVTLFQSLVPAFAVVAAYLFLGERLVVGQLVGGSVVVLGIMLARSRSAAPRSSAPPPSGPPSPAYPAPPPHPIVSGPVSSGT